MGEFARAARAGRPPGPRHGESQRPAPPRDGGQVSVEFVGMLPVILVTLILLWECALLGYTYTLAGNAADQAARQATAAGRLETPAAACERAGREDLSGAWRQSAKVDCWTEPGLMKSRVALKVPVLFPGMADFPFTVTGEAAAAKED